MKARAYLRSHVLGLVAIFIALTGTAVAAGGSSGDGPTASASVTNKQFKNLKKKVNADSQRISALEAKPAPVIPTTLPPSGPAGGSLTGNYPDPGLAANSVGNTQLGPVVIRTNTISVPAGSARIQSRSCDPGELALSVGANWNGASTVGPVLQAATFLSGPLLGSPTTGSATGRNEGAAARILTVSVACLQ